MGERGDAIEGKIAPKVTATTVSGMDDDTLKNKMDEDLSNMIKALEAEREELLQQPRDITVLEKIIENFKQSIRLQEAKRPVLYIERKELNLDSNQKKPNLFEKLRVSFKKTMQKRDEIAKRKKELAPDISEVNRQIAQLKKEQKKYVVELKKATRASNAVKRIAEKSKETKEQSLLSKLKELLPQLTNVRSGKGGNSNAMTGALGKNPTRDLGAGQSR